MSLAKLVKKLTEKPKSIKNVSDILYEQVTAHVKYKSRSVESLSILIAEAAVDGDIDSALDHFAALYSMMINARPRAKNVFHPSTLEVDCPRQLYYEINKFPFSDSVKRDIDGRTQIIFDLGTWFHLFAQIKLKEAGVLVKAEVSVESDEWKISGRGDGVLQFEKDGELFLLEIKTMADHMYKKAAFTGVFDKHKKQAGIYAKVLGIKKVIFLYFNKNTSEMRDFVWEVDDAIIEPQFDKMKSIIDAKREPVRECSSPTVKQACECPFKTLCFK